MSLSVVKVVIAVAVFSVLDASVARADVIVTPPPSFMDQTARTLDNTHDDLNARFQHVARQLDSFFKRHDAPDATSNSTVRVRLMLKIQDGDGLSPSAAVKAKMVLPYAEERLNLFVDNIKRGALPGDENPVTGDDTVQVGARVWLLRALRSHLSLEGGVKIHGIPDPFSQLELQYEWKLDGWVGRLTQDGFGYVKEGFGELTQVDVERPFGKKSLFRSTTAAQYTEESYGVEFEQTLICDFTLSGRGRNLIPSASVFAHRCGTFQMDNYRVNVTYRTCFFRPWLILELTPQIEFPRERDYLFTPSIRLGFEVWFGSLPENN